MSAAADKPQAAADLVTLEINGETVQVAKGAMINSPVNMVEPRAMMPANSVQPAIAFPLSFIRLNPWPRFDCT